MILNVPIPDKRKKGKKGAAESKSEDKDDGPREAKKAKLDNVKAVPAKVEEDENPFDEMDDEIPPDSGASDAEDAEDAEAGEEVELNEEDEEKALSKYEALLGGSDEEEESGDEDMKAKYLALLSEAADGDTADDESNSDDADGDEEDEDEEMEDVDDEDGGNESDRRRRRDAADVSLSPSPPPASRKAKKVARAKKPTGKPGSTTFLPSLMGGYISGSESEASDLDLAPPKKRLGQKQRQAIWEKKYGGQANHVKHQVNQQRQGARDNGWDMKRGAVGGDDAGGNKPWKKGVSNPLAGRQGRDHSSGHGRGNGQRPQASFEQKPKAPPKKDDEGQLHPSWEARKKAKEAQTTAAFVGTKITF